MFSTLNLLSIMSDVWNKVTDFSTTLWGLFLKVLYLITQCFVWLIDFLQIIFRKLAGVDTYFIKKSSSTQYEKMEGDIILNLITDKRIYSVFIGIVLLSVVLLFVTTIVAIIRSEYATEGAQNSKGKIIGKSIKGLFSFVLVPITLLLGLVVSNALLNALDGVTSNSTSTTYITTDSNGKQTVASQKPTVNLYIFDKENSDPNNPSSGIFQLNSTSIGGLIFESSMYNANRQRIDNTFLGETNEDKYGLRFGGVFVDDNTSSVSDSSAVTAADKIDMYFANGYYVSENRLNYDQLKSDPKYSDIVGYKQGSSITSLLGAPTGVLRFNRYNPRQVFMYYDLGTLTWLFLQWIAIVTILPAMISLCFALIRRIFEVIILFIISPPIAALIPLDNGEALKKWRVRTVGVVIEAYSCVVLFNLLFLLIPLIQQVNLFHSELKFINMFVNLLIICGGFGLIKDLSKTIGDFIGSANSLDEGNKTGAAALNTLKRAGTASTSAIMRPVNKLKARHAVWKEAKKAQKSKHKKQAYDGKYNSTYNQVKKDKLAEYEAEEMSKLSDADKADESKVANAKAIAEKRAEGEAQYQANKAGKAAARKTAIEDTFSRKAWMTDLDKNGERIRKVKRNGELGGYHKSEALKEKIKHDVETEVGEEAQDHRDRLRASLFGGDSAANFLSFKEAEKADAEGYGTKNFARNLSRNNAKFHYDMKEIRKIAKQNKLAEAAEERVPSMQSRLYAQQEAARNQNDQINNENLAKRIGQEISRQLDKRSKDATTTSVTTDVTTGSSDK